MLRRFLISSLFTLIAAFAPGAGAQQRDSAAATPPAPASNDPRVGLRGGWKDAQQAVRNLRVVAHRDRPEGFFDAARLGSFAVANSDMAFRGNLLFQGNFNGFQIWDITNPSSPTVRATFVCPGGQGDVSAHGNLLFMSVEETRGRGDCGTQGVIDTVSAERFRGVRIFDVSDVTKPKQIASVQTCRGSHTHTLVTDPKDSANVYVYVSGTGPVRSGSELAGCTRGMSESDTTTSLFRIEIIKVPLAAPQQARVVSAPRIFADRSTGAIAGLWAGGSHGEGTQNTSQTNQCHDITVYPELGLAAGACSGNGILLDISDPANPTRVDEVSDPNFAYWHSATFSNDGRKVLFSDEWGGGTAPRCRATDRPQWGADAIFTLTDRKMSSAGYYKLPAPQTALENCVAHNGSLVPVPGRDIMVQAWYQGGVSVFDFTDPAKPVEIAYFDRGPLGEKLQLGGYWSTYWYNGYIYGSEIARGLDVFELVPSEHLSKNEIAAAKSVQVDVSNPQLQQRIVWPASFSVARSYVDQLVRGKGLAPARTTAIARALDAAEKQQGAARNTALTRLATELDADAATARDKAKVEMLAASVRELAK